MSHGHQRVSGRPRQKEGGKAKGVVKSRGDRLDGRRALCGFLGRASAIPRRRGREHGRWERGDEHSSARCHALCLVTAQSCSDAEETGLSLRLPVSFRAVAFFRSGLIEHGGGVAKSLMNKRVKKDLLQSVDQLHEN